MYFAVLRSSAAPTVQQQERIASILSAYDDLIENNRRRIALLEEAARLLYREWFVHFRFPGHEHVKIIDGLPEGWERSERLGEYPYAKERIRSSGVQKGRGRRFRSSLHPVITGYHNEHKAAWSRRR